MTSTRKKIAICNDLIALRLTQMPDHHLYYFAKAQMKFIEAKLQEDDTLSARDYENVNIGMMCVKELDTADEEFCNAVYDMTDAIRPPDAKV